MTAEAASAAAPAYEPATTLAIEHFLYMLSFFYWHYTQNSCARGCPFAHGHCASAVELADEVHEAKQQTSAAESGDEQRTRVSDEADDEGPAIIRRRRRGPLVVDEETAESDHEPRSSLSLSSDGSDGSTDCGIIRGLSLSTVSSSDSHGEASRTSSVPWSKSSDDSGKKWIPVTDAEATLCLLQCIDQIRIDVAKVIHPYNTCHVEGFHDLR